MSGNIVRIDEGIPPWDTVCDIAAAINPNEWVLVGGLMVQLHGLLAGRASRATRDVDLLIDLMASTSNASRVVNGLEKIGFLKKEPGLRGSPFHRMTKGDRVVDVLVADHLPSRKASAAHIGGWSMMEVKGGAQAIERRIPFSLEYGTSVFEVYVPDLLGALVLKSAAYSADRRDRNRHLDDVAFLSSLATDVKGMKEALRGSDAKRLRAAYSVLKDENCTSWLLLEKDEQRTGLEVLRILTA